MRKNKCPHCGKQINIGSIMRTGYLKTLTKEQKSEIGKKLAKARWGKELSTVQ